MEKIKVGAGRFALVDADQFAALSLFRWYSQAGKAGAFYTYRRQEGQKIYMHRWVAGAKAGERVDHVNGDGLDNRRENLRLCSNAENMRNMRRGRGVSSYKGVAWFKRDGVWRSYIVVAGQQLHLGYFKDEKAAAEAYNTAALLHFGTFAKLNSLGDLA